MTTRVVDGLVGQGTKYSVQPFLSTAYPVVAVHARTKGVVRAGWM